MKCYAFILCILLGSCSPYLPSSADVDDKSIQIRVDCKNESLVVEQVIQTLRRVRINDLEKESSDIVFFIRARYQQLSDDKAEEIKDTVKKIPGVLDVLLFRDGLPVKNMNYRMP
jgi:hypothetical protein